MKVWGEHGRFNYDKIVNIWKDQNMSSFENHLAYCNN